MSLKGRRPRPHPRNSDRVQRLLLLHTTTGYSSRAYWTAAKKLGLEFLLGTDRCHILEDPWQDDALPLRFEEVQESAGKIVEHSKRVPIDAIIPLGDRPTRVAAVASRALGLPHNPPEAVEVAGNKHLSRQRFKTFGIRVPHFSCHNFDSNADRLATQTPYPCVLKPLTQTASRGVIRANNNSEFVSAFKQVRALLKQPDIQVLRERTSDEILVEGFIHGQEVAVEGILDQGRLTVVAIFDKPDPLNGPFFEETIYVTPSRLTHGQQSEITHCVESAVQALGLFHGPIHAEVRLNHEGAWMIEVAARSIGGLCSRAVKFESGMTLEEMVIRHALGEDVGSLLQAKMASGVMMIPIPKEGALCHVAGLEEALDTPGVDDIIITAKDNQSLRCLPEGSSYLGFIFATAPASSQVESALRKAYERLEVVIEPGLPVI